MNEDIAKALVVLKSGGTILYPTDTIWGIGCDATDSRAVSKVLKIKYRESHKAMIIMVSDLTMIEKYVEKIPEIAIDLTYTYKEPLTIVYENARNLPRSIIGSDGTIAIRIPRSVFCINLISKFGKPIISTSANITGDPFPVSFSRIDPAIRDAVDYICTTGQKTVESTKPSTIIKVPMDGQMQIIRS